jgi:hypothetical protein
LIEDSSTHAPAQKHLDRFQGFVGGNGGPALLNRGNHFYDISFSNLMDASAGPGLSNLPAKQPPNLRPRSVLGEALLDKNLQQILDAICYKPPLPFPLFSSRIASFQLGGEHLLSCSTGLV